MEGHLHYDSDIAKPLGSSARAPTPISSSKFELFCLHVSHLVSFSMMYVLDNPIIRIWIELYDLVLRHSIVRKSCCSKTLVAQVIEC